MALPPAAHRLAPNRRQSIRAGLNDLGHGRRCVLEIVSASRLVVKAA
jgi:hypothetical protein